MKADIKIMAGNVHFEIFGKNKRIEEEIIKFLNIEIVRLVNIFNFFDENSTLSQLNKNKKVKYSKELDFLLKESIKVYDLTGGKFNIFLGNQIKKRKLNQKSSKINMEKYNLDKLITNDKEFIYLNSKDLIIDLGGIAKGYIVDELLKLTKEKFKSNVKSLLIEARGDIGAFSKSKEFFIGIQNSFNDKENLDVIKLKSGNIITSGHTKQIFKEGSHIIGNRSEILTITIISEKIKCFFLDVLGTYFMQLDSQKVLELVDFDERFKDVECLVVLENAEFLKSSFWEIHTDG